MGEGTRIIPELPAGVDALTAALAYARAGLYVVPMESGSKNPGSVLRQGWPEKSSREVGTVAAWYPGTDYGVAIHTGRSGLIVLDVDRTDAVPAQWWPLLDAARFQSSRDNDPKRGAYVFATDRVFTSGPKPWGEIRSGNSVFVAEPSVHAKASEGGRYQWVRAGEVPELPDAIAGELAEKGDDTVTVSGDVAEFLTVGEPSTQVSAELAAAVEAFGTQGRHPAILESTLRLLRHGEKGHSGVAAAVAELREKFIEAVTADGSRTRGAAEREFGEALQGAADIIASDPEPTGTVIEDATDAYSDFWSARPELTAIRQWAYARVASPWAVLGVVLCRVLAMIPPRVVLPPIVGSEASLNLFVALVAPSGSGKGAAESVARDLLPDSIHFTQAPIGSGEGIAHLFAHREGRGAQSRVVPHEDRVLGSVPEVDTLTALHGRNGSTIMSSLRQAFSGEEVGFGYADPAKRLPLGKHGYRLCLVIGVQPRRAGDLMGQADGGTPQRFLWLPATDPGIPDQPPPLPEPLSVDLRSIHPSLATEEEADIVTADDERKAQRIAADREKGRITIGVPDRIAAFVRAQQLDRARGTDTEALDGHALLVRLKVATALALLNGHLDITDDDWELSGAVMAKSDETRKAVERELAAVRDEQHRRAGHAQAVQKLASDDVLARDKLAQASKGIKTYLTHHGAKTQGAVRKGLRSDLRGYFDEALGRLRELGQVVDLPGEGGKKKIGLAE
ncbi:bifunctional DNA primase/polymerase [Nocardia aobensis]|uniref:Bifunctional DNA primase/polymerase n=1 Tax=Nocardia aobensis TaxID=257277 RepID=A0ABW6PEM1_9NOCA